MAKTIKILKKHEILLQEDDLKLIPMRAEYLKKAQKWIYSYGMLPLLFPEQRKLKSFKEKIAFGMFKGMLIQTMIIHWSHHGLVFLIEKQGKIIGLSAIWQFDEENRAYRLPLVIADRNRQRIGVGSKVLKMCADYLLNERDGFVVLVPYLPSDREDYLNFYTNNGFKKSEHNDEGSITLFRKYERQTD